MRRLYFAVIFVGVAVVFGMAQIKVPRLDYKERVLSNGLRLLSLEDHASPTVAIQVWYKVGSKDDPEGRSGFAHLFEHMMFKGTKNMPDEMMDRLTEDVGGYNNASTGDDYTNYYEVVPSNYLETLLWAEADRLASLNVSDTNFKSERDVVKEEFRQRILAPPYGKLFYLIEQKSFLKHPYRRPGIGSIDELNSATIQDVQAFHATFYRPDNATLVVVGDFDSKQLDAWVNKYFEPIAKPDKPIPRVEVKEPPRAAEKDYSEYGPNVPLPAVGIDYLVPSITSKDSAPLLVAEAILSHGDSSRLYQSLVYKQQIAQEIFGNADLREDAGLFIVGAILASGKGVDEVERALVAEIEKMKQAPVDNQELEKAKNQIITEELHSRETNNGKAFALAQAAVLLGNPAEVDREIDKLLAVSAIDVQRVLKDYCSDKNRIVIQYLPESARKSKPAAGKEGGKR